MHESAAQVTSYPVSVTMICTTRAHAERLRDELDKLVIKHLPNLLEADVSVRSVNPSD